MNNQELIKAATVGLMADRAESITLGDLYSRVQDQSDRVGVNAPSWAAFVESVRECPFLKLGQYNGGDLDAVVASFVYPRPYSVILCSDAGIIATIASGVDLETAKRIAENYRAEHYAELQGDVTLSVASEQSTAEKAKDAVRSFNRFKKSPCPSCRREKGFDLLMDDETFRSFKQFRVHCPDCGTTGDWASSVQGAVREWNAKPRFVACPNCGMDHDFEIIDLGNVTNKWSVKCLTCEMSGPVSDLKSRAVDLWNGLPRGDK
jgi:hypothetical protein